jgi:hypothetical protein
MKRRRVRVFRARFRPVLGSLGPDRRVLGPVPSFNGPNRDQAGWSGFHYLTAGKCPVRSGTVRFKTGPVTPLIFVSIKSSSIFTAHCTFARTSFGRGHSGGAFTWPWSSITSSCEVSCRSGPFEPILPNQGRPTTKINAACTPYSSSCGS